MTKKASEAIDFDFLLSPSVQFENCVSPTPEALERFGMVDANHRHVTGRQVLDIFWSEDFQKDRPSLIEAPAAPR